VISAAVNYFFTLMNEEKSQIESNKAAGGWRGADGGGFSAEYAEKIREFLAREKANKADIHLSRINPDELTNDDLMVYDKFVKGSLKEEELKEYRARLHDYFNKIKEEKEKNGETYNFLDIVNNSSSNMMAMIWHQFECWKIHEKLNKKKTGIDFQNYKNAV